ncbi:MAG: prephenate dehydratase [Chitinophagaceae bacterium]|nr:prephenate dehydratase [Chitinophagaceae bacterium]
MKKKIAIQGYEGSFHHLAAIRHYGEDIDLICCDRFSDVVQNVSSDPECKGGVMAIENSIVGSILPNYGLIAKSGLYIPGEVYLQIDQNLLVNPDVQFDEIREVHSHPMALLQCADFLEKQDWKIVSTEDTALSALRVHKTKSKHIAAIAGKFAAQLFNLEIIRPNIQTNGHNYTRFWILQKKIQTIETANKASMVFVTDHSTGALARVLTAIAQCGVNMTKVQSLPIPGTDWKYAFHVDCEFANLDRWHCVLEAIKPVTASIKVYGVYTDGKNYKNA